MSARQCHDIYARSTSRLGSGLEDVKPNNAIIMARVVELSDSYISFVFAIPQFLLVVGLNPRNLSVWFFGMSLYSLVGFWAYFEMYCKGKNILDSSR